MQSFRIYKTLCLTLFFLSFCFFANSKSVICPTCKELNDFNNRYCIYCSSPTRIISKGEKNYFDKNTIKQYKAYIEKLGQLLNQALKSKDFAKKKKRFEILQKKTHGLNLEIKQNNLKNELVNHHTIFTAISKRVEKEMSEIKAIWKKYRHKILIPLTFNQNGIYIPIELIPDKPVLFKMNEKLPYSSVDMDLARKMNIKWPSKTLLKKKKKWIPGWNIIFDNLLLGKLALKNKTFRVYDSTNKSKNTIGVDFFEGLDYQILADQKLLIINKSI